MTPPPKPPCPPPAELIAEALSLAIDLRDPSTGAHCRMVGEASEKIAAAIGLSERDARIVGLGGRLHDLGKIAIPDRILHNSDEFDDRQTSVMRAHAANGERKIAGLAPLDEAVGRIATIVGAHHERWDGGGYPRGLRGAEIPLGARIVAVADVFSAMVMTRTYQAAMPIAHAIEVIVSGAGSCFDPDVVAAALGVLPPPEPGSTISAMVPFASSVLPGRRRTPRRRADGERPEPAAVPA